MSYNLADIDAPELASESLPINTKVRLYMRAGVYGSDKMRVGCNSILFFYSNIVIGHFLPTFACGCGGQRKS